MRRTDHKSMVVRIQKLNYIDGTWTEKYRKIYTTGEIV